MRHAYSGIMNTDKFQLSLKSLYMNDATFAKEVRMINSIALVPLEKTDEAWAELKSHLNKKQSKAIRLWLHWDINFVRGGISVDDVTGQQKFVSPRWDRKAWNMYRETAQAHLFDRDPAPNGLALVNPAKSGKKGAYVLVELASQIATADQFTRSTAGAKLSVIAEQVRFLQDQARKVLEEARLSSLISHTACNFKKIPGKFYYIYKQRGNTDKEFLSMISPQEWGKAGPEFVAGYRPEFDMSWTRLGDLEKKNTENALVNKILDMDSGSGVQLTFLPSQYQANLPSQQQALL